MRLPAPARWTLLRKFTVLSLVCFAALGVALSQLLAHQVRQRALSNTVASAQLLSSTIANGQLRPSDLSGKPIDPARLAALDATFAQARTQHRLARLKVWSLSGQIVYSDDHSAIGRKFEAEDDLKEAFAGDTHSAIATGKAIEQQSERKLGTLLEAYVPLRFGSPSAKPAGAFEIYVPYAPVAAAAARDVRKVHALVAGGLTLLFLLLYRIVGRASRSLRRQAEENRRQALHDPLTGLPNRRSLYERLDSHLASRRPLSLLVADLDGFKELNDTLGHRAGDEVALAARPARPSGCGARRARPHRRRRVRRAHLRGFPRL